jgi:NADH dehydrogenase FAD-containing subunit
MRGRNHVIDVFERADSELDPGRRRVLLTFVVAGGGFSGAELAVSAQLSKLAVALVTVDCRS